MSLPDNNLRKLSAAHARGLIDTATYRRLRTAQLGAMEFNRKVPELSEDMQNIAIPKQKIDVPHEPRKKKSSKTGLLIGLIILALLAGGGAYFYLQLQ